MVQLTRIYTRGGDKGKTSLGSGKRVSKSDVRIHAIGEVDEATNLQQLCVLLPLKLISLKKKLMNSMPH